jgi:hypothetical protein
VAINSAWHEKNRMPTNAIMVERVRWHEDHARICGCWPIPLSVRAAIEDRSRRVR